MKKIICATCKEIKTTEEQLLHNFHVIEGWIMDGEDAGKICMLLSDMRVQVKHLKIEPRLISTDRDMLTDIEYQVLDNNHAKK